MALRLRLKREIINAGPLYFYPFGPLFDNAQCPNIALLVAKSRLQHKIVLFINSRLSRAAPGNWLYCTICAARCCNNLCKSLLTSIICVVYNLGILFYEEGGSMKGYYMSQPLSDLIPCPKCGIKYLKGAGMARHLKFCKGKGKWSWSYTIKQPYQIQYHYYLKEHIA